MKKLLLIIATLVLASCATVEKVSGAQTVNNRLTVQVTDAWNKVVIPGNSQPYVAWTQEGVTMDHLRFWAAIKAGEALIKAPNVPSGQKAPRIPTFVSGMQPDQLVNLFETMYSVDGSLVTITKVEPTVFANEKGTRFEFAFTRKGDDVQLQGVGWVTVRNNELFAATFVAPRLSFFGRLLPKAQAIVKTAAITG